MQSSLLVFLLCMLVHAVSGQVTNNGEVKTYFEKGEIKSVVTYKDGVKNGLEEIYHSPGKIWKKANYTNGKLNGYYEEYSIHTGKITDAGNYKENKKDGIWRNFIYRVEEEYKDDVKHGKSIGYHADSSIAFKTNYIDGKQDGKYESWHKNGTPKEIASYKSGILHGERKLWYDDGKPQAEGNYIDGIAEGNFKFYSGSNRILTHEATLKNGKLDGRERQWNYDGYLIRESHYMANIPTETVEYGKTPIATYKERYKDGYLSEKWIWDTGGKKKYHKVAINDSVYADTLWYSSGKVHFVHIPDIKSNTLKYFVWYEDGKLKKEGQLVGNRWHGEWAHYATDGRKLTEEYNNGIREKAIADADIKGNEENGLIILPVNTESNRSEFFFGEDYTEWPIGDMIVNMERNHEDNAFDLEILERGLPATYPGGDEAAIAFLQNKLKGEKYNAGNDKKAGCIVQIAIDKYGKASFYYTSERKQHWKNKIEAAVADMPLWQPAVYKGKFVRRSAEYTLTY